MCPKYTSIIPPASKVCSSLPSKRGSEDKESGSRIKVAQWVSSAWGRWLGRPVLGTFSSECYTVFPKVALQANFRTTQTLDSYWFHSLPQTFPDYLVYAKYQPRIEECLERVSREKQRHHSFLIDNAAANPESRANLDHIRKCNYPPLLVNVIIFLSSCTAWKRDVTNSRCH